jgi:hypothetical protein
MALRLLKLRAVATNFALAIAIIARKIEKAHPLT